MTRVATVVLAILVFVANFYLPDWYEREFLPPQELRSKGDVMLDVIGEGRVVLARYLWFKMDLFHEELDGQGVENSRQAEVMPLLRMVSLLDPSMTDAFDNIAWDLWHGHRMVEEALEILDEGLAHNPQSAELFFRKAMILHKEERHQEAQQYAREALSHTNDHFLRLNILRTLFHSQKELEDVEGQRETLSRILQMRPGDSYWKRERDRLDAS